MRRSKQEVVDRVGCRSDTGPGNPYWNKPVGSTGGVRDLGREGDPAEAGIDVGALNLSRAVSTAAVAAAPESADTPATRANVALDIGSCDAAWEDVWTRIPSSRSSTKSSKVDELVGSGF